jgi:hypothetical protein
VCTEPVQCPRDPEEKKLRNPTSSLRIWHALSAADHAQRLTPLCDAGSPPRHSVCTRSACDPRGELLERPRARRVARPLLQRDVGVAELGRRRDCRDGRRLACLLDLLSSQGHLRHTQRAASCAAVRHAQRCVMRSGASCAAVQRCVMRSGASRAAVRDDSIRAFAVMLCGTDYRPLLYMNELTEWSGRRMGRTMMGHPGPLRFLRGRGRRRDAFDTQTTRADSGVNS